MFIYQVKYFGMRYEEQDDESIKTKVFIHENLYSEDEFQNFINLAKMDMGHYTSFKDLPKYLNKYGFNTPIVGYFE